MGNGFLSQLKMILLRRWASFALPLMLFVAVSQFVQADRIAKQERQYHQTGLKLAVESTAREVELYVGGLSRALELFAGQEGGQLVEYFSREGSQAGSSGLSDRMSKQVARYFPGHLTYALSDVRGDSLWLGDAHLFGEHCRQNVAGFTGDPSGLPPPMIHNAGSEDTQHFDILARIPMLSQHDGAEGSASGILFISFRLGELDRLLERSARPGYKLVLSEQNPSLKIASEPGVVAPVANTRWKIYGLIDPALTQQAARGAYLQASLASLALIAAGLLIWRATSKQKHSQTRTKKIVDEVEADRKRIARDLHDQVLADASHIRRLLGELVFDDEATRLKADNIEKSVARFSQGIRTAIADLHPHTLDLLGLGATLAEYAAERCATVPEYQLNIAEQVEAVLSSDQKLQLFRISAELLNNSLQHANCRKISLQIERINSAVQLVYEDDGIGFEPTVSACDGCSGLANIQTRVGALNARARWMNVAHKGVRFELMVPLSGRTR